jgi:TonB-dependent receptor
VGNGVKNLGVALTASYQEVLSPFDSDLMQYQNTTSDVAWFNNYLRQSGYNNRFISAVSARADYRLSAKTTVSLRFLYNAGSEPFFNYTAVQPRVTTNVTVYDPVTNPNGAIMPGYTTNRTEIRPAGNASMFLNPQRYSFTSKNPTGTLMFDHNLGRLKIDHAYRYSNTAWNSGAGRNRENGTLQLRTPDGQIGFTLDNSNRFGGVFKQNSGPDVYNPASYAAFQTGAANTTTQPVPTTSVIFNKRDTVTDTNEWSANVNATYTLETSIPIVLKGGLDTINRRVNNRQVYPRRWYGVVGSVMTGQPLMELTEFEIEHGGRRLPVFDPTVVSTTLNNPALWYEDVNFTATSQKTNRRIMEEGVDAAYIQAQARFGKLTALGGVRGEWVSTDTFTYFRARSTPIAQEPDHFKRAELDYNKLSEDGSYNKYFPSLHLAYDITKDLKVRGSYSTSYGRPFLAQLIAGATPNDTARTVTTGNPSLLPQEAENFDLKLEYYFKNSGMISITGYQKKISDYIGTAGRSGEVVGDGPDNGFDGLYAGYEIVQPTNVGTAEVKGIEFDFRQRLAFLPGVLKGTTLRANYTYLKAEGKFAGTTNLNSEQIAGFVPKAFNIGLLYAYKNFGASFDVNYTGEYPTNYNSATPGGSNFYRYDITRYNAGVTYRFMRNQTVFLSVNNIGEEGTSIYTYTPIRPRQMFVASQTLKFGITGQF